MYYYDQMITFCLKQNSIKIFGMNLKPQDKRSGFVPVLSREEPEEEVRVGSRVDIEETFGGNNLSELGSTYAMEI